MKLEQVDGILFDEIEIEVMIMEDEGGEKYILICNEDHRNTYVLEKISDL